ncbi:MAG TPA: hypothetical protein PKZ67_07285 [Accumulibacter sp.]|uniref:Uncharacterized protein n=1 Tax=Candidatus Accumulibacter cognatus TaxID=2954383 RepID=A0A7D5SNH5_9PROT|nr:MULTISPECIES: hypothetical protein [Candidatus Accumulibacter]MCC2867296.1 hypothetical protein [Candidatus Accumulibacter phosphatis]MBL8400953.1 hypothetical protein [Accumulibacter sp.]MBN8517461.1 hypothetical protein [Accumulibacter sp.]MBO3710903.1 hypothetical protein [Accumulibacter sp.]MCM8580356.1 hypothetical protein [Accumulibacter sp.]
MPIASDAAGDTPVAGVTPGAQSVRKPVDQEFALLGLEIVQVEHAALVLQADRHLRHVRPEEVAAERMSRQVQVAWESVA